MFTSGLPLQVKSSGNFAPTLSPYIGSVSVLGVVLCTQSKLQGLSTLPKKLSVTSMPKEKKNQQSDLDEIGQK